MQSITGFVLMINGVPLLYGSLKQTVVVDSTCSAEYVAASVCCKQIIEAENMVQFLGFTESASMIEADHRDMSQAIQDI